MARRNKRASMREGPLADLFRSTSQPDEDIPEEPAEYEPGRRRDRDADTRIMRSAETTAPAPERAPEPEHEIFDVELEDPGEAQTGVAPAHAGQARPAPDPVGLDRRDPSEDVSVYRTAEPATR